MLSLGVDPYYAVIAKQLRNKEQSSVEKIWQSHSSELDENSNSLPAVRSQYMFMPHVRASSLLVTRVISDLSLLFICFLMPLSAHMTLATLKQINQI